MEILLLIILGDIMEILKVIKDITKATMNNLDKKYNREEQDLNRKLLSSNLTEQERTNLKARLTYVRNFNRKIKKIKCNKTLNEKGFV